MITAIVDIPTEQLPKLKIGALSRIRVMFESFYESNIVIQFVDILNRLGCRKSSILLEYTPKGIITPMVFYDWRFEEPVASPTLSYADSWYITNMRTVS